MKNLILAAAIVLGSVSTFATPISNLADSAKTIMMADEYTQIKVEEVPAAVSESLVKAHPEAVITKAFVNKKNEYKLEVKVGDKEETVLIDAAGKWLEV